MEVHGRDVHQPRRVGLEFLSVATGVIASQGVLAALIGNRRGQGHSSVETSALRAAFFMMSPFIAAATSGDEWSPPVPASAPGPPFWTADGHWLEFETLDPETWDTFWGGMNVGRREVSQGWNHFSSRFRNATCSLPAALHEATAQRTLTELSLLADASGVSMCRVRDFAELLANVSSSNGDDVVPWTLEQRPVGGGPGAAPVPPGPGPLTGIRVVEVTRRFQGPLAGLLLRMLGADVVRVEPPDGDLVRSTPPLAGDIGATFLALNRGKASVEIDPKTALGRTQLLEMVADADVFLHNWRPGRASELSLESQDCLDLNPRLVYAHASGWGGHSTSYLPIATDFLVQAYTALGTTINPVGEPPFPTRFPIVDFMGGLLACEGILAGLYLREGNGRGCRVETSLLGAAMALQSHVLEGVTEGTDRTRQEGRPVWGLLDKPLQTARGFLMVTIDTPIRRQRCHEICEVPLSATDDRVAHRLLERPASEWVQLFLEADIPCSSVCTDLAALADDVRLAGLLEPLGDTCRGATAPWRFIP